MKIIEGTITKGGADMTEQIQVFKNPEFGSIRTLTIDGQPWFVGKDVADILGYSNSRKSIADHVDEEDKGVTKCDTLGGTQDLSIINESGLYSLILSSKLPAARRFRRWVTGEVLPSIRRHGLYAIDDILSNPDLGIAALQALKAEREANAALTAKVTVQEQRIAEMRPKASYYDRVLSCPDALPISIIAKDYGWSAMKMNRFLHQQGVQYKLGDTWLLYAKHADRGFTKSETCQYTDSEGNPHNRIHTKWTQAGRLFIYRLMTAAGHPPREEEDEYDEE